MIRKLLDKDPLTRIGAKGYQEIKNHPFFSSLNEQNAYFENKEPQKQMDLQPDPELNYEMGIFDDSSKIIWSDYVRLFRWFFFYDLVFIILRRDRTIEICHPSSFVPIVTISKDESVHVLQKADMSFEIKTPEKVYYCQSREKNAQSFCAYYNQ